MGQAKTDWELGFKQFSFHLGMQVLRVCNFLRLLFASRFTTMLFSPLSFDSRWGG
jgi:hypothetical protein